MPLVPIRIVPQDTLLAADTGDCHIHLPLLLGWFAAPSILRVMKLLASFIFILGPAVGRELAFPED